MGVVVLETPHPGAAGSEKGGAGTAGTGMQRSSPAAQGERGSQRCAKLKKKKPSSSNKVEICRLVTNRECFPKATRVTELYSPHIIYTTSPEITGHVL